jgi:Ca-activated chloride channel family protein
MLSLLLAVPVLAAGYLLLLRRKKQRALRLANLVVIRQLAAGRFVRHVPPLLFMLALISLIVAAARPVMTITLPFESETVILAIDTSISMRLDDVAPSRIDAAKTAAKNFILQKPRNTRIGIVSFAGSAFVEQAPTTQRDALLAALNDFALQNGTAIGGGILVALKLIFPDAEFRLDVDHPAPKEDPHTAGSYPYAIVILLTDGESTTGPDPIEAARVAAKHGVRVFTVGVGAAGGGAASTQEWPPPTQFDDVPLKRIAHVTGGEYFHAGSATDLSKIYGKLGSRLVLEKKNTEISAFFTAMGAALALLAAALSMLWFNRIL